MPCGQAPPDDEIEELLKSCDAIDYTKSKIVAIDNELFIEPDLNELFPCLTKYCSDISYNYHCNNLYRILFKCANNKSKSKYINKLTEPIVARKCMADDIE